MQVIYDVDEGNSLILPDEGVPHADVAFLPALSETFAVELETTVYNPYPCFGGPANAWPRGFPLDAVNDPKSTGCAVVTLNSTSESFFNERRSLGVVQALANRDPDVDTVYRLAYPIGEIPFNFEPPQSTQGDRTLKIVPPTAFTPYNAQVTEVYRVLSKLIC